MLILTKAARKDTINILLNSGDEILVYKKELVRKLCTLGMKKKEAISIINKLLSREIQSVTVGK